jgi:molecular chaperone HtpG
MTEQELIENLGTIARSGTREFSQMIAQAAEAKESGTQLIGQFGVGFYSAYLVADRVTVVSRAAGSDQAYCWESDAKESFTIVPAEREARGTTIVLHLKPDQKDFAQTYRLKEVIRRHSDYVGHPIELEVEQTVGEGDEKKTEKVWELVNQANALWQRPAKEVELEQYQEFYKHLSHDWEDPLAHRHFRIEGTQMFTGIVFLPKTARADLLDPRGEHGVRLHVRRILAMESCEELLPKWLRFVRGVVDSEDLPLNVSRETLQDSKAVKIIRKQVTSQVLSMIEELETEKPEDYLTFYEQFGSVLKEGLYFEPEHKDRLAKLLRFKSSESTESTKGWVSLSDYVSRMKEGQPGIYYVEGQSVDVLKEGPHLEQLKKKGFEVLFMTDGVDPFALEQLTEFEGKKLINAMQGALDLGEGAEESEEQKLNSEGLVGKFKEVLGELVADVRTSKRLAESPACLVTAEGGLPPHMEAMFRAQNLSIPAQKRILEVNPDHPVVRNLQKLVQEKPETPELREWMEVLYDQALIAEGSQVKDPTRLAKRLTALLSRASGQAVSQLEM